MTIRTPEIGSDVPPAAAAAEPPATASLVATGSSADTHMGVTDNAILLLGFIAGAMMEHGYIPTEVDAASGAQVLCNTRTNNTFRVSVVQLEGTE